MVPILLNEGLVHLQVRVLDSDLHIGITRASILAHQMVGGEDRNFKLAGDEGTVSLEYGLSLLSVPQDVVQLATSQGLFQRIDPKEGALRSKVEG